VSVVTDGIVNSSPAEMYSVSESVIYESCSQSPQRWALQFTTCHPHV